MRVDEIRQDSVIKGMKNRANVECADSEISRTKI